jgi:hypothetical protein
MDMSSNKRKHARYALNCGAEVNLNVSRLFGFGKEKKIKLGPVVDMSLNGMAIRYAVDQVDSFKAANLSIVMPGRGTLIEAIPFEIVNDCNLNDCPGAHPLRRCGLKFGTLSEDHLNRLKVIIQNYAEKQN